jgi:hypothetical protein
MRYSWYICLLSISVQGFADIFPQVDRKSSVEHTSHDDEEHTAEQPELHQESSTSTEPNALYPLDGIIALIYHTEGTEIILLSDLRPPLDGSDEPRSLRQAITERLMVLDAKTLKVIITEDEVDRFIAQIQKQYNMTRLGMERLFNNKGYNYDEGRQQLLYKQYIEHAVELRVKANKKLIIQRDEVEEYYRQHPDIEQTSYTLVMGFVPEEEAPTRADIDALLTSPKLEEFIAWEQPFEVRENELPDDKKFIKERQLGEIVEVERVDEGWQITKLIEKTMGRELPLSDQRYEEIALLLIRERGQELLTSYENELLSKATIRFVDSSIRLDT